MKIQKLIMDNYKTQMDIEFSNTFCEEVSEEYEVDGLVKFQFKLKIIPKSNNTPKPQNNSSGFAFGSFQSNLNNESQLQLSAKFVNMTNNNSVYIQFSSNVLNVLDMCIKSDSKWHMITEKCVSLSKFDIHFTLDVENNTLKVLYDDDELTDFELRGDNGSVRVHKCILAAISPVFKTMIQGDWKETRNGYILLEGMSKDTLQEFKQYIYLNSLPSPVSQQILIIAMLYQMPNMEIICIDNLVRDLKAESVCDLLEFAVTQKSDRLKIAILERVQNGFIKVDQIKKQLNEKGTQKDS